MSLYTFVESRGCHYGIDMALWSDQVPIARGRASPQLAEQKVRECLVGRRVSDGTYILYVSGPN